MVNTAANAARVCVAIGIYTYKVKHFCLHLLTFDLTIKQRRDKKWRVYYPYYKHSRDAVDHSFIQLDTRSAAGLNSSLALFQALFIFFKIFMTATS